MIQLWGFSGSGGGCVLVVRHTARNRTLPKTLTFCKYVGNQMKNLFSVPLPRKTAPPTFV